MTKPKMKITYAFIVAALAVALSSSYIIAPVMAQGQGLKFRGLVTCTQQGDTVGATVTCTGNVSGAGTGATVDLAVTGTTTSGCKTLSGAGDPPGQQANIVATGTAPIADSETGGSTPFSVTTTPVAGPAPSCPSANMTPYFTVDFDSATVTVHSPGKQDISRVVPVPGSA
jgi:hypothetical protein